MIEHTANMNRKPTSADTAVLYENLTKHSYFSTAKLYETGIGMMDDPANSNWEILSIGLTDNGFFIAECLHPRDAQSVLYAIITDLFREDGIIVEEC